MMYRWLYCVLSKVGSLEGEKRPTWNPPFCAGPFTEEGQSVCGYISASLTFPKSFLPHKCGTCHLTLSLGSLLKAMVVYIGSCVWSLCWLFHVSLPYRFQDSHSYGGVVESLELSMERYLVRLEPDSGNRWNRLLGQGLSTKDLESLLLFHL